MKLTSHRASPSTSSSGSSGFSSCDQEIFLTFIRRRRLREELWARRLRRHQRRWKTRTNERTTPLVISEDPSLETNWETNFWNILRWFWIFSPSSLSAACRRRDAGRSGCPPSRGRQQLSGRPAGRLQCPRCGTGTSSGHVTPAAGVALRRVASQTPPSRQRCSVATPAGRGAARTAAPCLTCSWASWERKLVTLASHHWLKWTFIVKGLDERQEIGTTEKVWICGK